MGKKIAILCIIMANLCNTIVSCDNQKSPLEQKTFVLDIRSLSSISESKIVTNEELEHIGIFVLSQLETVRELNKKHKKNSKKVASPYKRIKPDSQGRYPCPVCQVSLPTLRACCGHQRIHA